MNVDDLVQQRIEAARQRAEREKRQRAELTAARAVGLGYRQAQRLRNLAAPRQGAANNPEGDPMPTTPFRTVHCPSCRAQRTARHVGTATVPGGVYEVLRCPQSGCGLQWLIRAEQPRTAPAAA